MMSKEEIEGFGWVKIFWFNPSLVNGYMINWELGKGNNTFYWTYYSENLLIELLIWVILSDIT